MLSQFKPRKAKYGFRTRVRIDSIKFCADLMAELSERGGAEGEDFFFELQNEMSTTPSNFIVYVNGEAALKICNRYTAI